ncbi:uncharacterized protein LOC126792220 [Argentina anserina]|uniref:uncharacterized protein LOC126792220 n=1 Tax=Argentina anserina TaxID=57926 RepID=UPI0021766516|nr:uncharacterized protein LOC126792220 [Potentilla anserina]
MDGPVRRFQRMYMCFKAQKDGWNARCRLLICLDGCHIKGHHPGQLLIAVGIDGMYPIAYAFVKIEDQATWIWFLEYLKGDLDSNIDVYMKQLCILMLNKGIVLGICTTGEGLKQLMWNAVRSSTETWYKKHMDDLKMLSPNAFNWFHDKPPRHWSKSFFVDDSKCDILLNNLCESFNHAILPCRDKLVLTMFEKLRMDMMVKNANRRVSCEPWKRVVGPRIKKIIVKIAQRVTQYKAHRIIEYSYQVTRTWENGSKHEMDLGLHTCTCRRWKLSGIPCVHALCVIRFKKHDPDLYCDDYIMASTYLQTYTSAISPIVGQDD